MSAFDLDAALGRLMSGGAVAATAALDTIRAEFARLRVELSDSEKRHEATHALLVRAGALHARAERAIAALRDERDAAGAALAPFAEAAAACVGEREHRLIPLTFTVQELRACRPDALSLAAAVLQAARGAERLHREFPREAGKPCDCHVCEAVRALDGGK